MNKTFAILMIIIVILNLVLDLVSPPTHLYRVLIQADILCILMSILLYLYWRKANDR